MSVIPVLHRDNPDKPPLVGHIKVTREDWLNVARAALVSSGVAEVKVLGLAQSLNVSRSSFYGYFENREHLLEELLDEWGRRNTRTLIDHCAAPAETITGAVCNFFRCFVDPALFDKGFDFAIREWSRRDEAIRRRIDAADRERLTAIHAMFARFGYETAEADARARILYFMQLGYHALEVAETMETRMSRLAPYLKGFTGVEPDPAEVDAFRQYAMAFGG